MTTDVKTMTNKWPYFGSLARTIETQLIFYVVYAGSSLVVGEKVHEIACRGYVIQQ